MKKVATQDGSFTCYSEEFNEHYHSVKEGALNESLKKHVELAFELVHKNEVTILDICYGLGFNTLSTLYYLRNSDIKVHIKSPEYDENLVKSLINFEYPKEFKEFKNIIKAISESGYYEDEKCSIELYFGDARKYLKKLDIKFDIIYQDAFSPKKNPLLWTYEYFKEIDTLLKDDGILTTYSSATAVRMSMFENNFRIYEHKTSTVRKGTIASKEKLNDLKEIDMLLKQKRNPQAKATYDVDFQTP